MAPHATVRRAAIQGHRGALVMVALAHVARKTVPTGPCARIPSGAAEAFDSRANVACNVCL